MDQGGATKLKGNTRARLRAAGAVPWAQQIGWRSHELGSALRETLERELSERAGFPWLAAAFGAGSLAYFSLPREPLFSALLAATLVAAVTATCGYRRGTRWRL